MKRIHYLAILLYLGGVANVFAQNVGTSFTGSVDADGTAYDEITYIISKADTINGDFQVRIKDYSPGSTKLKSAKEVSFNDYVTYKNKNYWITDLGSFGWETHYQLTEVRLPSKLKRIGEKSFQSCYNLQTVRTTNEFGGDSLKVIGNAAFAMCGRLRSLPFYLYNVEVIEPCAFVSCDSLTLSVSFPRLDSIGEEAFRNSGIKGIELGDRVTRIPARCFLKCEKLTKVKLPASLKTIEEYAFNQCYELSNILLPLQLETIGNNAFYGCRKLNKLVIPEKVTHIGENALGGNIQRSAIHIKCPTPPTVETQSAIDYNADLIVPANSLSAYQNHSFWGKFTNIYAETKTTSVSLKETNVSIQNINGIKTLYATVLPSNATTKDVIWSSSNPDVATVNATGQVTALGYGTCTITATTYDGISASCVVTVGTVPVTDISLNANSLTLSQANQTAKLTATIAPENANNKNVTWVSSNTDVATVDNSGLVTAVANGSAIITATTKDGTNLSAQCSITVDISPNIAFADVNAKTICVQNWDTGGDGELNEAEAAAVTDIGEAFKGNTEITSFNELQYFTDLTQIGNDAFRNCSSLTSVAIPSSVTKFGYDVFRGCSSLTSLTIPNSVTRIEEGTFYNCSSLTSMTIHSSVTNIEAFAFHGCTGLTSLDIPSSVTYISNTAFGKCSGLTSISVDPDNSKYDSRNNCNAIIETATNTLLLGCKNTSFPNSVTKIGSYAFYYCSELTTMIIPSTITFIGSRAFYNCSSLTSVTIPSSVTTIGAFAFSNCPELISVTVNMGTPITITSDVFSNRANATLYVPAGSKTTYESANYWKEFKEIIEMEPETVPATDITLSELSLTLTSAGQTSTLVATVTPSNATNKNITWTSSNTAVATVDENGVVTAVANGTSTITATTNDGTNLSASCEVTVSISTEKKGDTNGDNEVSVTDYLAIANYILGQNVANFNASAADVNGDNDVSVVDYVGVANIILYGNYTGPSANAVKGLHIEQSSAWMEAIGTEDGNLNLLLHEMKPFAAFQMDINLPEGVEIIDAKMSKKSLTRNLGISKLEDGTWRLLYGTLENKAVALDGDNLLTLELASAGAHSGTVSFENIVLVDNHASATKLNDVYVGLPTGIRAIESGLLINIDGYDLAGRKITNPGLKKGIYIVNGKKVLVK